MRKNDQKRKKERKAGLFCQRLLKRFPSLTFQSLVKQVLGFNLSSLAVAVTPSSLPPQSVFLLPNIRPRLPPAHQTSQRKKNLKELAECSFQNCYFIHTPDTAVYLPLIIYVFILFWSRSSLSTTSWLPSPLASEHHKWAMGAVPRRPKRIWKRKQMRRFLRKLLYVLV